jgi:hypothetical protein
LKEIEEISNKDLKFALNPGKFWKRTKKGEVVEMDIEAFL